MTEFHEACYSLCKLYHVLDGVSDLDGTLLPQCFPGLQERKHRMYMEQRTTQCVTQRLSEILKVALTGAYLSLGVHGRNLPTFRREVVFSKILL